MRGNCGETEMNEIKNNFINKEYKRQSWDYLYRWRRLVNTQEWTGWERI